MSPIKFLLGIEAKVDYLWGAIFGAMLGVFGIGLATLITIPVCSVLWAMGGDKKYNKLWRRAGCAVTSAVTLAAFHTDPMFLLGGVGVFGVLSIGYGLPDPPDQNDGDPGSLLGWTALALADGNYNLATILLRSFLIAACAAVYSMSLLLSFFLRA